MTIQEIEQKVSQINGVHFCIVTNDSLSACFYKGRNRETFHIIKNDNFPIVRNGLHNLSPELQTELNNALA